MDGKGAFRVCLQCNYVAFLNETFQLKFDKINEFVFVLPPIDHPIQAICYRVHQPLFKIKLSSQQDKEKPL